MQLCFKTTFCRENNKYVADEIFVAIFALAERLPTSATLTMTMTMTIIMTMTMTSTMTSAFQTSGNTRWPSSAGDLYCFLRIEASAFDV